MRCPFSDLPHYWIKHGYLAFTVTKESSILCYRGRTECGTMGNGIPERLNWEAVFSPWSGSFWSADPCLLLTGREVIRPGFTKGPTLWEQTGWLIRRWEIRLSLGILRPLLYTCPLEHTARQVILSSISVALWLPDPQEKVRLPWGD